MKKGEEISLSSTVVAAQDQVFADLGTEVAILHLKKGIYYGLDGVGARVWHLIQQPKKVVHIQDVLLQEYQIEAGRCHRDLLVLLQKLSVEALIEVKDEAAS